MHVNPYTTPAGLQIHYGLRHAEGGLVFCCFRDDVLEKIDNFRTEKLCYHTADSILYMLALIAKSLRENLKRWQKVMMARKP